MSFEGFADVAQDFFDRLLEDTTPDDHFDFLLASEATSWITQVIEFASQLELEVFQLLAEARGFQVVILSVIATAAGIIVTLSLRPKKSGIRPAHS